MTRKQHLQRAKPGGSVKDREKAPPDIQASFSNHLAAGVALEEAGEKWKAGDAAKSMRFFSRAIDKYDLACRQFPEAFEPAYNKARLQYQIAEDPRLRSHSAVPLSDQLRQALRSHRVTLQLRQDDPDTLFNTAQVLTSLEEALSDGRQVSEPGREESSQLLEEAIELFQRCLTLQEFQYANTQAQSDVLMQTAEEADEDDVSMKDMSDNEVSESTNDEHWASIEEPVTRDSLLDTAIAQLYALTELCETTSPKAGRSTAWIEEYGTKLLSEKIALYSDGSGRRKDAARAQANFQSALLDANYRNGSIGADCYERELLSAFSKIENLFTDPQGLCDEADALMTLCVALADSSTRTVDLGSPAQSSQASRRWKCLSHAQSDLAMASKLASAQNIYEIHMTRGDIEMLRYQLSQSPIYEAAALKSASTLLNNAQVYYRGAAALAKQAGLTKEEMEAQVKEAIAKSTGGDRSRLEELLQVSHGPVDVRKILDTAVEEGLVMRV